MKELVWVQIHEWHPQLKQLHCPTRLSDASTTLTIGTCFTYTSYHICLFRQKRAVPTVENPRNGISHAEVRERDEKWKYESLRFLPAPFSPRVRATSHPIPFASLLAVANESNDRHSRRSRMYFHVSLSFRAVRQSTMIRNILVFSRSSKSD